MRLWTLHPKYLDAKGLVALWREALLAQKVLDGKTKGYRHHPQLIRFRAHSNPVAAVAAYLKVVHEEATRRGYEFDVTKILHCDITVEISETDGQVLYEWEHLKRKLKQRAPSVLEMVEKIPVPDLHPIFKAISGKIQDWEILTPQPAKKKNIGTTASAKSDRPKPSSSRQPPASRASAPPRRTSPPRKSAG